MTVRELTIAASRPPEQTCTRPPVHLNICRPMTAAWTSKVLVGTDPGLEELLGDLGGDEVDDL